MLDPQGGVGRIRGKVGSAEQIRGASGVCGGAGGLVGYAGVGGILEALARSGGLAASIGEGLGGWGDPPQWNIGLFLAPDSCTCRLTNPLPPKKLL